MDIKNSLELILKSKETLGATFYHDLLQRYPDLKQYFENVDLSRQAVLLTMQLSVIEVYYTTRSPAAEKYLQVLGTKHRDWGVPQDVYERFREVLMDTLQSFHGDDWSEELAEQWRGAMDAATQKMFDGYDQRFSL